MSQNTAETLGAFAARLRFEDLPEKVVATARLGIVDCTGVAIAGSGEAPGKLAAEFVAAQSGGQGPCTLIGNAGVKAPSALAALANGASAHAMDYDDVNWSLIGHPSASLVPCLYALGEERHASGKQMVTAYIVGLEVMARFGQSCQPKHSLDNFWHPTSTIGAIGCAAASANLLGLSASQAAHALAAAASMSDGLVRNFGTMVKPLHAGLAAQHGLTAASLAGAGFVANTGVFDVPGGFHDAFCKGLDCKRDRLLTIDDFFDAEQTGLTIKPYPCGVASHPAIDAMFELVAEHRISAEDVESGEVGVTRYTYGKLFYDSPETELQGKFSMAYPIVRVLLDGRVGLSAFTEEAVNDASARDLVARFGMHVDEEIEANWKGGSRPCRVTLQLRDGRTVSKLVEKSKGDPSRPLSWGEIQAKFMDCATQTFDADHAGELLRRLESIGDAADVGDITKLLV